MSVVRLVQFSNRETIALLKCLLAQATAGEVVGLAVCARHADGGEDSAFSGLYRSKPAEAVNAAMRLSWRLTQAQDDASAEG